ncbi:MAG TPA: hypothetical protein VEV17_20430 [Bryobacteraceae bacterium]|nr:hypothetical protein [Bryobacteraceae bacterium]
MICAIFKKDVIARVRFPNVLLAPVRFIQFVRDNVVALTEGRQREAGSERPAARGWQREVGKLLVRAIGAGLVAFAVLFAFKLAELAR